MAKNISVDKRVQDVLARHLQAGENILAAVSGGADSMAMLDLLLAHQDKFGYRVEVVHIHHHLRQASDAEWDFVESYCAKRGVPFHGRHIDVLKDMKGSMEATAHKLRYQAFDEVAAQVGASWICLAHHANDRAETLLANLMRGTSIAGLGAMPECNGHLLRPMIAISRAEIEAYCVAQAIAYVTDESNADTTIQRNRIRHELMPTLVTYNPEIIQALNRLATSAELEQDFLNQEATALTQKARYFRAEHWCMMKAEPLRGAHPACFAAWIRQEVQALVKGRSSLHAEMIAQCQRLLHEGGQYDLGAGLVFEATRHYVYVGAKPEGNWYRDNGYWRHDFLESSLPSVENLVVRTVAPGDHIRLKNIGAKKLKKIFQEAGWPIVLRSCWPIVYNVHTNEIIWLPFLARSTSLMYYYRVIEFGHTLCMELAQQVEQVIDKKKQEDS